MATLANFFVQAKSFKFDEIVLLIKSYGYSILFQSVAMKNKTHQSIIVKRKEEKDFFVSKEFVEKYDEK